VTGKEPYPSFQSARVGRYFWFHQSDRAAAELGYRPRPLADSLADAHAWFAGQGAIRLRGANRWWMRPGGLVHSRPTGG
jgi:dihydroflavonol-4-reductase